ncbi:MAG: FkbM family methyltransferase, partial [Mycobacterium sp.]|nr:FkbM family methyltransferase [Mycobacterium sp.]
MVVTALERLGRRGVAVDIGANVGDTLAVIARYSMLDILCVEPSEYFLPYLRQNVARHFADRATVVDWYVTAREGEPARALLHWGGTAKPIDGPHTGQGSVVAIGRLVGEVGDLALLKIDTDGADLALVEGCLDARAPTFPIYFELEITAHDRDEARTACTRAQRFFARLLEAGYGRAFLWDDPGRFYGLLDLSAPMAVTNL